MTGWPVKLWSGGFASPDRGFTTVSSYMPSDAL